MSKTIEVPIAIGVRDLAQRMSISPIDAIKKLMSNGVMASINQTIDFDTAAIVAAEFGFEAVPEAEMVEEKEETGEIPLWRQKIANEKDADLVNRAPVVTSWVTWITARPPCSMQSARRTWRAVKRAALPSTLAHIRLKRKAVSSPFWIPPATPRSLRCALVALREPTSWCWWLPPTMA
jgi:hypothetical protein